MCYSRGRTRDIILAEDSVSSRYPFSQSLLFGHKKKPYTAALRVATAPAIASH